MNHHNQNGNQNHQHHDEGRHDPNKGHKDKSPKDNIVDIDAEMIYQEKHWKPLSELRPDLVDSFKEGTSPLTQMLKDHTCEGVLHIKGSFFEAHMQEIMGSIRHSDDMARERDPMNRVVNIVRLDDMDIGIFTSKNQLAVTLGKKLDSAYKGGDLNITWSKGDREVEVVWTKDLD